MQGRPDVIDDDKFRLRSDRGLDFRGVEVERLEFHVHETRREAGGENAVGGGDEREGGRDHLVAALRSAIEQRRHRHDSRIGAGARRDARRVAEALRESLLETLHVFALRNPVALQTFIQIFAPRRPDLDVAKTNAVFHVLSM